MIDAAGLTGTAPLNLHLLRGLLLLVTESAGPMHTATESAGPMHTASSGCAAKNPALCLQNMLHIRMGSSGLCKMYVTKEHCFPLPDAHLPCLMLESMGRCCLTVAAAGPAQVEGDFLPLYKAYGTGLTIWSLLASGLLTGKHSKDHVPPDSRLAQEMYKARALGTSAGPISWQSEQAVQQVVWSDDDRHVSWQSGQTVQQVVWSDSGQSVSVHDTITVIITCIH